MCKEMSLYKKVTHKQCTQHQKVDLHNKIYVCLSFLQWLAEVLITKEVWTACMTQNGDKLKEIHSYTFFERCVVTRVNVVVCIEAAFRTF